MNKWPMISRPGSAVIVLCLLLALTGCSGGDSSESESARGGEGAEAPEAQQASDEAVDLSDIVLTGLDGSRSKVSDYRGKILFVTFLATWQKDSQEIIPILSEIHRKHKMNIRVMVVATDKQGASVVRSFFADDRPDFDIFVDGGSTANRFGGARKLPTTYIVDRESKFFYRLDGLQRADKYNRIILSLYRQHL